MGIQCVSSGARDSSSGSAYFLANVDVPEEEQEALRHLSELNVATKIIVRNDTLAILRAGAPEGWGVAVVSGAGINAVGNQDGVAWSTQVKRRETPLWMTSPRC